MPCTGGPPLQLFFSLVLIYQPVKLQYVQTLRNTFFWFEKKNLKCYLVGTEDFKRNFAILEAGTLLKLFGLQNKTIPVVQNKLKSFL